MQCRAIAANHQDHGCGLFHSGRRSLSERGWSKDRRANHSMQTLKLRIYLWLGIPDGRGFPDILGNAKGVFEQ